MPDYSPHYNLIMPHDPDFYDVEDFSGNMQKIDDALHALDEEAGGQMPRPPEAATGNVPIFDGSRALVDSGVSLTALARLTRREERTLHATNWYERLYTISTDLLIGLDNPPGDVGPIAGVTEEQNKAWSEAIPAIVSAQDGTLVLRADGVLPEIDIPIQIEVRS